MIKSKRLTAGLLKKKPTWSFIQTIFITTFAGYFFEMELIMGTSGCTGKERRGGGGGSRRKIKEFVMSSFA